jgi:branched-chain amino acid aminotransferase
MFQCIRLISQGDSRPAKPPGEGWSRAEHTGRNQTSSVFASPAEPDAAIHLDPMDCFVASLLAVTKQVKPTRHPAHARLDFHSADCTFLGMKIFLDGALVESADAKISVFDHGLLYGDGIFEGIRLYGGNVFRLDQHLERLEYSAKAILLKMPWTRAQISEWTCETCRANGLTDGYIRLVVTRGVGNLGLSPNSCPKPSIFIIADKIQLYPQELYAKGMPVITVPTRRINPAALAPTIKSLNYLNNILAKIEATNVGFQEAFMLNDQGYISECTGDNAFTVHKDQLFTPTFSS